MGPLVRYLGPEVPKKAPLIWQDPLPAAGAYKIDDNDVKQLKQTILSTPGLNTSNLITTAWGSASTFRISDKRGGANGARIALKPQNTFAVNNPDRLKTVIGAVSLLIFFFGLGLLNHLLISFAAARNYEEIQRCQQEQAGLAG